MGFLTEWITAARWPFCERCRAVGRTTVPTTLLALIWRSPTPTCHQGPGVCLVTTRQKVACCCDAPQSGHTPIDPAAPRRNEPIGAARAHAGPKPGGQEQPHRIRNGATASAATGASSGPAPFWLSYSKHYPCPPCRWSVSETPNGAPHDPERTSCGMLTNELIEGTHYDRNGPCRTAADDRLAPDRNFLA
jgi:hypothetical protein